VRSIDLNADVGEGTAPGGDDGELLDLVTSASVACGFHAGDPASMRRTVEAAVRRGVAIGAHPSYRDRAGFGRRPLDVAPAQVRADVLAQVGALERVARAAGARVRYVKAHGALYHRMADDEACARAVVAAVAEAGDLVLLAPPAPVLLEVARGAGVPVAVEAFADRAYRADGRLVPRTEAGAVRTDSDDVARQALSLALDSRVTAVDGTEVALVAASICLHGDTPGAVALARAVRHALESAGVVLAPFAP